MNWNLNFVYFFSRIFFPWYILTYWVEGNLKHWSNGVWIENFLFFEFQIGPYEFWAHGKKLLCTEINVLAFLKCLSYTSWVSERKKTGIIYMQVVESWWRNCLLTYWPWQRKTAFQVYKAKNQCKPFTLVLGSPTIIVKNRITLGTEI